MKATVAICTYNRAGALALSLPAACGQQAAFDYEVLVVDNNSTDATADLVARMQATQPRLRSAVERRAGLAHARNCALQQARGEIVAFIDDDGVAQAGWLAQVVAGFHAPDVGCVAGRIVLDLPGEVPDWFTPGLHPYLAAFDRGPVPCETDEAYGCNFAVRRSLALALGGFSAQLGFKQGALLPGEDTDMTRRIRLAGHRIWYAPSAVVLHRFDRSRLCREWFLTRHRQQGRAEVLIGTAPDRPADAVEAARDLVDARVAAVIHGLRGEGVARFHALLRAEHRRGRLDELSPRLSGGRRLGLRAAALARGAAAAPGLLAALVRCSAGRSRSRCR